MEKTGTPKEGDLYFLPEDADFTVIEVDDDNETVHLEWEDGGVICRGWLPQSMFQVVKPH